MGYHIDEFGQAIKDHVDKVNKSSGGSGGFNALVFAFIVVSICGFVALSDVNFIFRIIGGIFIGGIIVGTPLGILGGEHDNLWKAIYILGIILFEYLFISQTFKISPSEDGVISRILFGFLLPSIIYWVLRSIFHK